jgi:hypothetical protein
MPNEKLVLRHSSDGQWVSPARTLAAKTRLPVTHVRRIQRYLKSIGLLEYGFLINEDDGLLCGRGYHRSSLGDKVRKLLD